MHITDMYNWSLNLNRIRSLDDTPGIRNTATMSYMEIPSHEAIRRIIDLAFRDAYSILDLTYGAGNFWNTGIPEDMALTRNNINEETDVEHHFDFTCVPFNDRTHDLVILDPPHMADGGTKSILAQRYGTIKGTEALKQLITDGCKEAWRLAKVGVVIKVIDSSHGGEFVCLSDVVKKAIQQRPYFVMYTVRDKYMRDDKHNTQRVPKNNGAIYLVFRKDGYRHKDFDREFLLQDYRL